MNRQRIYIHGHSVGGLARTGRRRYPEVACKLADPAVTRVHIDNN